MKNLPTVFSEKEFQQTAEKCELLLGQAANFANSVSRIHELSTNLALETRRLEHQLDAFIFKTQSDIVKFEILVPVVEKQLQNLSDRIDKLIDKLMDEDLSNTDDGILEKHNLILQLLMQENETFNNAMMKMLSL